jgi:hypothetical protein
MGRAGLDWKGGVGVCARIRHAEQTTIFLLLRSESTQIVHWLIRTGPFFIHLHLSIRRGKNDFITSGGGEGGDNQKRVVSFVVRFCVDIPPSSMNK